MLCYFPFFDNFGGAAVRSISYEAFTSCSRVGDTTAGGRGEGGECPAETGLSF